MQKTKEELFADIKLRQKPANARVNRAIAARDRYLKSPKLQRLNRNVQNAMDAVNKFVYEWNDVVLDSNIPWGSR